MADASADRPRPRARFFWLLLLGIPLVELIGHGVVVARVPSQSDWREAAQFVRKHEQQGDAFSVAPRWADPLLREVLGDRMSLAMAGRSDLAPYRRLWALTIRGHRPDDAPSSSPVLERRFGRVRVLRWDLGPSPVLYDLVQHVRDARVSMVRGGVEHSCPWGRFGPRGGGLGAGPAEPAEHFKCRFAAPWLWVGPTVIEDLAFKPRYCVFQQPQGPDPVRVEYPDVPLGDHIVLYAGLYALDERPLTGAPVDVVVKVDGQEMGRMVHRDGDGWKRMDVTTRGFGDRGTITIETSTRNSARRSLCWAATVRKGQR